MKRLPLAVTSVESEAIAQTHLSLKTAFSLSTTASIRLSSSNFLVGIKT